MYYSLKSDYDEVADDGDGIYHLDAYCRRTELVRKFNTAAEELVELLDEYNFDTAYYQ